MGDYDLTLGTLLIGIIFNTYLFGFVTSQFITYYRLCRRDPQLIKWMVTFLFSLDTFHSIAVIWMAWRYCITGYGKPETLLVAEWPYPFTPVGNSLASLVIQLFLGWRVYILSGSKLWYISIICLAVPSCAIGCSAGIKAWIINDMTKMSQLNTLTTVWLVMQVGVDFFVCVSLGILLSKSRTGFKKTDTVLNRLIRGAIQTGLFAGIFSILDLICFLCWPTTNLYGMFAIPVGRIYTNTLLDTLNSRSELRTKFSGSVDVESDTTSAVRWGHSSKTAHQSVHATQSIPLTEVGIQKDVVVFMDERDGNSQLERSDTKHFVI